VCFLPHVVNVRSTCANKLNIFFYVFVRVSKTLPFAFLQERTEVISTYALCGFANFGSIGIMLGGLGVMAPHRKSDMAKVVVRAMIAGNVACFMTACIAGKCALSTIYLLNKK